MNGKCARCQKTVYQVEELKCLDKIWHKGCFRCTICGMALNLKNYKGFNRMPYCNAHVPKVQATAVASTPEMKRVTNNTRLQSNVKYHEEYERDKKIHSQCSNDGATSKNSKQSAKLDANVAYRVCKLEHKNIVEQRKRQLSDISRQSSSNRNAASTTSASKAGPTVVNLYDGKGRRNLLSAASSVSKKTNDSTTSNSSSEEVKLSFKSTTFNANLTNSSNSVDSIDSVDTITSDTKKPRKRLIAGNGPQNGIDEIFMQRNTGKENQHCPLPPNVSSGEIDPSILDLSANVSSVTLTTKNSEALFQTSHYVREEKLEEIVKYQDSSSQTENKIIETPMPSTSVGIGTTGDDAREIVRSFGVRMYRALFDFYAKEVDEVSFQENDVIIEVEKENYGWITGRVERTGKIGLIPANYLERYKSESQMKLEKSARMQTNNFQDTINKIANDNNENEEGQTKGSEDTFREVLIN